MEEPLAPLLYTVSDHDTENMEVRPLVCSADSHYDCTLLGVQ